MEEEIQEGQIEESSSEKESNSKQVKEEEPKSSNTPKRTPKIRKPKQRKRQSKKQIISSTYRTKKCEFYSKGSCNKGSQCQFSHDFPIDKQKKMCKFFLSGNCSRGASCFWNHNTNSYPCKFYHLDKCCKMGSECRFSHSMIPEPEVEEFLRDNKEYLLEMYASKKLVGEAFLTNFVEKKLLQEEGQKNSGGGMMTMMPYFQGGGQQQINQQGMQPQQQQQQQQQQFQQMMPGMVPVPMQVPPYYQMGYQPIYGYGAMPMHYPYPMNPMGMNPMPMPPMNPMVNPMNPMNPYPVYPLPQIQQQYSPRPDEMRSKKAPSIQTSPQKSQEKLKLDYMVEAQKPPIAKKQKQKEQVSIIPEAPKPLPQKPPAEKPIPPKQNIPRQTAPTPQPIKFQLKPKHSKPLNPCQDPLTKCLKTFLTFSY